MVVDERLEERGVDIAGAYRSTQQSNLNETF
jgi:hypothetical protein